MAAPTPDDALNYAKRWIGNAPIDDTALKFRVLTDAHAKLWMAAPWQWTVAALEEVPVVNSQQDNNLVSSYPKFLKFLWVHWTDGEIKKDLNPASILASTSTHSGPIEQVAFLTGSPQKLRFYPVPAGYSGSQPAAGKVLSIYKQTFTPIDGTNEANSFNSISGMHDEWFWVYQEIVLWRAMVFAQNNGAGGVTVTPQGPQYTGQAAVVQDAIAQMMAAEEKFWKSLGEPVPNG